MVARHIITKLILTGKEAVIIQMEVGKLILTGAMIIIKFPDQGVRQQEAPMQMVKRHYMLQEIYG